MQVFRNGWFLFVCIAVLVAANVSLYRAIFAPRVLTVSVLDVEKAKLGKTESPDASQSEASRGSAALVRTPGDMTVLINAGPDASILRALGGALPLWQRRIDAVILTGTRPALVGGLPDVERRYRVGAIVRAGDARIPYGTSLVFDGVRLLIISPETFAISYSASALTVSSTTPAGAYALDGGAVARAK